MARINEVHTWRSKQRGTVYLCPPPFTPDLISRSGYLIVHNTWIDWDGVTLSEMSQRTKVVYYHLHVASKKRD